MAPKFGTSGLRGLVTELTPQLVSAHVTAFVSACPVGTGVFVGRDLRASSPRVAGDVIAAVRAAGIDVTDCGALPTPALALAAMRSDAAAIMVTGSHIPDDRNGLKFYTPHGEITKDHEAAILLRLSQEQSSTTSQGSLAIRDVNDAFVARYVTAFGPRALAGRRIAVWSHSAVGRDLLMGTLNMLGAEVIEVARSQHFVPVDTEAVSDADRAFLRQISQDYAPDAIVSTDGDGDRPLVADENGEVVPGDVLGQIVAQLVGASTVVTPVSSNTGAEAGEHFARVIRTKIGSPYVIAAMEASGGRVVGYEANGGFLLGYEAQASFGALPALITRDSHLPIIAALIAAEAEGVSARVVAEPARFTVADRLQDIPTEISQAVVTRLRDDSAMRDSFLDQLGNGKISHIDTTDGLRLILDSARIVHLRPSGNAPELRMYAEAETAVDVRQMLSRGMQLLKESIAKT
jgi:phosphomannomutase